MFKTMYTTALVAGAAVAAVGLAAPASAAITIATGGNTDQGETVQFNTSQTGPTVTGTTNQTGAIIDFIRGTVGPNLQTGGVGQAVVTNVNTSYLTGIVTVDFRGNGTANYWEFNLPGNPGNPPPPESSSVKIYALGADGVTVLKTTTLALNGNGNNYFHITADGVDLNTVGGFRVDLLTLDPATAVSSLQNVRVNGVAGAVPEPGSWALMLVGFGAVGFSMRRRRRASAILQMA